MRPLLIALLTAALSSCVMVPAIAAEDPPIIVKKDLGGMVEDFELAMEDLRGRRVIIDGQCDSACTMLLMPKFGIDVCVTHQARIRFHKIGFFTGDGENLVTLANIVRSAVIWRDQWLASYPKALREWLQEQAVPSLATGARGYATLEGAEAREIIGACTLDDLQSAKPKG